MVSLIAAASLSAPADYPFTEMLAISPVGEGGRSVTHTDAIEKMIVAGTFVAPKAGETVTLADGKAQTWKSARANAEGWFEGEEFSGGYAFASYDSPEPRVMLLEAAGHSMAYVNGAPRAGDVYGYGYLRLPVLISKGTNTLLFATGRGRMRAKLVAPKSAVALDLGDPTLPDFVAGERSPVYAAVVITNATESEARGLVLEARCGGDLRVSYLPTIAPLTVRKVGFLIPSPGATNTDSEDVRLTLKAHETAIDTATLKLRVRTPEQSHRRTFVSAIDGSVQYYAVQPAQRSQTTSARPGLVLSVHGASVEAQGQADAYGPKTWTHIVAPTNRRPYGFDWEDWGRLDALEVLADAERRYNTDPSKTYLTGHSMGGHGTWQLGVHFPDKFAGIAPSAGWISFWSYVGRGAPLYPNPSPVEEVIKRAVSPGDTLNLAENLRNQAIYILHGDVDDNVPISESNLMAKRLDDLEIDYTFFVKKGEGHWWDDSEEPGSSCVDWPQMFDMFANRRLANNEEIRRVRFLTVNPANSSTCHWATIESQEKMMAPSRIDLTFDPLMRRFHGITENVSRLSIDVAHLSDDKPISIELDGQKLGEVKYPAEKRFYFAHVDGRWSEGDPFSPDLKGPHRYGPFKHAFNRKMVLVYGTKGRLEENAWAFYKARFDAETFYYRGNGSVDLIRDVDFGPTVGKDRSVILYGNADTNSAWKSLLGDSPLTVGRARLYLQDPTTPGKGPSLNTSMVDRAVLFLRPRPGSDTALVGAVSGTGVVGMRLTDRLPYFMAGVQYPDVIVIGPEMLDKGTAGIDGAGFFGPDWTVKSGDFAFPQP
ncbi:MAG: prolyl oligopeptidase family serine peptidase [Armatimonadetes bacterium]|nr:prolyl oligopeptidase family serine peptidase [Armatimonadota bacterium]